MVGCRRFRRLWQARWPGRSKPALVSAAGSGVGWETGAVVCGAVAGIGTQADRRRVRDRTMGQIGSRFIGVPRRSFLEVDSLFYRYGKGRDNIGL